MTHLRCNSPDCATTLDLHARGLACPSCGDLLEVVIDRPERNACDLKKLWRDRRTSYHPLDQSGVWRFRELLPFEYGDADIVTLAEGNVPLVRARKAAAWAGVTDLSFKHLGWNPTGSFKDLGMTAAITEARFT
jgi:threonine synthase